MYGAQIGQPSWISNIVALNSACVIIIMWFGLLIMKNVEKHHYININIM